MGSKKAARLREKMFEAQTAYERECAKVWKTEQAETSIDNAVVERWKPPSNTVVTTMGGGYYYVVPSFDQVVAEFMAATQRDGHTPEFATFETAGGENRRVFLLASQITAIMDISPREEPS